MTLLAASFGALNFTVLGLYLAVMVAIGIVFAGRQKTTEDYFLAGRKMPWLVVGMSMYASLTSAISYMGIPGRAYEENAAYWIQGPISFLILPILIRAFYPFYRILNVTTTYEYILQRYGPTARTVVSALFVLARLGWLGTVIYAPALALSAVTGMDLWLTIALMGILATGYTALGGLAAVLWTDLIQFVVLVGGAAWVAVSLTGSVPGGMSGVLDIASDSGRLDVFDFSKFSLFEMTVLGIALSYFCELLQSYGTDQVTVQRLLAVRSPGGMTKAALFNAFSDLLLVLLLLYVGLGLFAYVSTHPTALPSDIRADGLLPAYIMHALPVGVSGLVITGIFAAAMSSMDSGINSLATVLVKDFIGPAYGREMSERGSVQLARSLTLALGLAATGVAFYVSTIEKLLKASSSFLGLFAAPVLVIFVLGMLSRRINFAGWLVGVTVSIPATLFIQHKTDIHFTHYFTFGFVSCALTTIIASLLIPRPLAPIELTLWGRDRLRKSSTE